MHVCAYLGPAPDEPPAVAAGFRQTLFLPPGLRGSVRVCAYAAEAQDAAPDARRSLRLRAR